MSIDHPATATDSATAELRRAYEHAVSGTSVRDHYVRHRTGAWVHVLERGRGTPVVVLHGTGSPAGFMLPLLEALDGVRVLAPDLPGVGLSDPAVLPRASYREAAVGWLDGLLDALELDRTALVGHCPTRSPAPTGYRDSC